jgi:hypothetical protein
MALTSGKVRVRAWLLTIAVAVCSVAVLAQQKAVPAPTTATEHLDAAREVRALREELQRAASAIVAAHVVVGRLQLIDRRMSFMAGQIADVRRDLVLQQSQRERPLKGLKNVEEAVAAGASATGFAEGVAQARAELAAIDRAENVLRAREAQLDDQMKSEERQWLALEARLGQLEAAPR